MLEELKAIFLGLLQGMSEFLPISSSGHIVFVKEYVNLDLPSLSFIIYLHMGSLFAILIFLRNHIKGMAKIPIKWIMEKRWIDFEEGRLFVLILFGSLPIFCVGPFLRSPIERIFELPKLVGILTIINGIMLWVAERYSPIMGKKRIEAREALLIGLAQILAILPGISRSGVTIATGMLMGIEREVAASYSFLLAILIILGAGVWELFNYQTLSLSVDEGIMLQYLLGALGAFCAGVLSLRFLFWTLRKKRLSLFSLYCIVIGSIMVVIQWVKEQGI